MVFDQKMAELLVLAVILVEFHRQKHQIRELLVTISLPIVIMLKQFKNQKLVSFYSFGFERYSISSAC